MTAQTAMAGESAQHRDIARRLLDARRQARALPDFPGALPQTLSEAYAIQDAGVELRETPILGWKVGRVAGEAAQALKTDHLAGPVYAGTVEQAGADPTPFSAILGGFCAIEAEFIFVLKADAPAGKTDWTQDEAADLVAALHIGVEIAGSAIAELNALGPRAVIADGGGNSGVILGPEIPGWRTRDPDDLPSETFIDGVSVGRGSAGALKDGPLGSLCFLLAHVAARGRPARAGQFVATGQTTGIHAIAAGQTARASFGAFGAVTCRATDA